MRTVDPKKLPRILTAASQLFAERPFAEVRMSDVAARANVAKGTLYLHFDTKESLFRAMIAEMSGRLLDEAQSELAKYPTVEQRLRALIVAAVQFMDQYPHYLDTIHRLNAHPERVDESGLTDRREKMFQLIVEQLQQGNKAGDLMAPHPERSTLALLGMLHRVLHATPRPWPTDLADWIADQFLFGIRLKVPS